MYHRYREIIRNARRYLDSKTTTEEKLFYAAKELYMLRIEEIPEHSQDSIKRIKEELTKKPDKAGKGKLLCTIESMNERERLKWIEQFYNL